MDSHLLEIIERTTSYLEARLREPVSLDDVSRSVGVSKFHLLRIWKGATSTGIMEYVRRRRLALSLSELLGRSHTIEFIAWECAFGSERAYNRAFREEFGVTPARWRRYPLPLAVLERFNPRYLGRSGEALLGIQAARALPAFSAAGLEIPRAVDDPVPIRRGLDYFYERRRTIVDAVQRDVYLGISHAGGQETRAYHPSIQVGPDSIVPPGLTVLAIGPRSYAVFRYMGPHDPRDLDPATLAALWKQVFRIWPPEARPGPEAEWCFERIDFAQCSRRYCVCDLYCPIRRLDDAALGARDPGWVPRLAEGSQKLGR